MTIHSFCQKKQDAQIFICVHFDQDILTKQNNLYHNVSIDAQVCTYSILSSYQSYHKTIFYTIHRFCIVCTDVYRFSGQFLGGKTVFRCV